MGYLVDGEWRDGWYDTSATAGEFVRPQALFRDRVGSDPACRYPAEPGRYHLYVSLACPWSHRTVIFRKLKGLADSVSMSVVEPVMSAQGWAFSDALPDHVNGCRHLHELYTRARPGYSGRVTVPLLWDTATAAIVNNESSEIVRMFNADFACPGDSGRDYYPPDLRSGIDEINAFVYSRINNGVYRCGFAGTQQAYEAAAKRLFDALDVIDARLEKSRYLLGAVITEADWRLFVTLVRFDAVYHGHFKCNLRRIEDYPNLAGYLRDLYQTPGIADTVDFDHIKRHYYVSHSHINPGRLVPIGPRLDFERRHGREGIR